MRRTLPAVWRTPTGPSATPGDPSPGPPPDGGPVGRAPRRPDAAGSIERVQGVLQCSADILGQVPGLLAHVVALGRPVHVVHHVEGPVGDPVAHVRPGPATDHRTRRSAQCPACGGTGHRTAGGEPGPHSGSDAAFGRAEVTAVRVELLLLVPPFPGGDPGTDRPEGPARTAERLADHVALPLAEAGPRVPERLAHGT